MRRRVMLAAAAFAGSILVVPAPVSAEGLFDFFFGGSQKQQSRQAPPQANFFADPFGLNQQAERQPSAPISAPRVAGSGPAYCVRSCDGKYFPLTMRGNATPAQLCQAFCPASATKVYYGSHIDSAASTAGERYADSENAFAYRKALRADCTCNGRDPAGLAPVDLALDASLRAGDVIATTDGLVAYTGIRVGNEQSFDFTPVASYPGLTSAVRARLGEMKVAPVSAEIAGDAPLPETRSDVAPSPPSPPSPPSSVAPKGNAAKPARRAEVN
ncbi:MULTISPECIES: DUF2865 domain-containing protein [unclassified Bradyrhizobium]|uniref:DUF2865 domain-containing protein n=1 Tax=unclassified Bradyrhizobium TaxID=2631580 RepID=UPI0020A01ADE|nr:MULTISPECIES: DUF2865 domain-containing protein [unclassified Bradyrhizobium]